MKQEQDLQRPAKAPVVERHIDAPPDVVFSTATDAWLFPVWVVGATHVRDVDEGWPAPGMRMHHQVGPWPISLSDTTEVVVCDSPDRLVLQARAYPFGQARVELTVEPDETGSLVRMAEWPTHGPALVMDNPLQRMVLIARNRESLARLAAIAENRREIPLPMGVVATPPTQWTDSESHTGDKVQGAR